jgi:hypothetical protein
VNEASPSIDELIALTPVKAAAVTGRTRTRIFAAIKNKELTAHKDGRATIIEVPELRRWIRSFPTTGRAPGEAA